MTNKHNDRYAGTPVEFQAVTTIVKVPRHTSDEKSVTSKNYLAFAADVLERTEAELVRLQSIVDKLPKTADGKRYDELERGGFHNERTAYFPYNNSVHEVRKWRPNFYDEMIGWYYNNRIGGSIAELSKCYSTKQAALDAMKETKDG